MTRSPRAVPPAPVSRSSCSSAPSTTRSAPRSAGPSSRRCRGSGPSRTLYDVESSSIDFAPDTPSFTLLRRRLPQPTTSRSAPTRSRPTCLGPSGYAPLMRVPRRGPRRGATRSTRRATYPFVDVADRRRRAPGGLSPDDLRRRVSRDQVAGDARRPDEPGRPRRSSRRRTTSPRRSAAPTASGPAAVCHSRGVRAADAALRTRRLSSLSSPGAPRGPRRSSSVVPPQIPWASRIRSAYVQALAAHRARRADRLGVALARHAVLLALRRRRREEQLRLRPLARSVALPLLRHDRHRPHPPYRGHSSEDTRYRRRPSADKASEQEFFADVARCARYPPAVDPVAFFRRSTVLVRRRARAGSASRR